MPTIDFIADQQKREAAAAAPTPHAAHPPTSTTTSSTSTGAVSPQDIYVYLRSLGVSEASAAGILANIKAESNFNPSVTGDNGTSGGLFQHHLGRWDNLKAYAVERGTDWTDWKTQVDFALIEARQMGINLQHTSAHDAAKEWSLRFERPAGGASSANSRAHAASQYMYGDPAKLPAGTGNAAPQAGNETLNLPSGGSWFRVGNDYFVAFRFYGNDNEEGPSQVVYYRSATPPPAGEKVHSESSWNQWVDGWVDGGSTDTFRGVPAGKSYQDLVNDLLMDLGLMGSDALEDAGVMAIIAIAMTREMSEAELTNRLRQTDWWNDRTEKQREWNDLSDAEQNLRTVDAAMAMVGLWFTYTGLTLDVLQYDLDNDGVIDAEELRKGNPDLYDWALKVASGEVSQVQVVNVWMKPAALEDANSPWSRTLADEEKARGEQDVNVANMAGDIKDLYNDWGIPITDERADFLALEVVMNRMAFEEVEAALQEQANGMYPNKPENMATREWAQPYMQLYQQTLEVPEVELDDATLGQALSEGLSLSEFKSRLRQDDRWLETDNARGEMNTKISSLGRVMGF